MIARGPYFDELHRGQVFDAAPALTLTSGGAALHQAIVGDRLALATDHRLGRMISGGEPLAHPAYVWDVAIGQSTTATFFVRANLFYRDLAFRRFPALGDTLSTTATVVALRQNTPRPGRPLTGLAALRVHTTDQEGRAVLDFHRCAMLPLAPDAAPTDHTDDLDQVGSGAPTVAATGAVEAGETTGTGGFAVPDALRSADLPRRPPVPEASTDIEVWGGDVVSSASELARLTLNVAHVHHDARAGGGRRLVYGGHTIGVAAAQLTRALPGVLTFLGWTSCDHTGPVHEGDTLRSRLTVEGSRPVGDGLTVLDLRSVVHADPDPDEGDAEPRPVLDWRVSVLA